jgi:hypothetical protein
MHKIISLPVALYWCETRSLKITEEHWLASVLEQRVEEDIWV